MNIFGIGLPEMVVIMVVALLIFGPKKLPEIGRSMGKAIKSFQDASREFQDEINNSVEAVKNSSPSSPNQSPSIAPAKSEPVAIESSESSESSESTAPAEPATPEVVAVDVATTPAAQSEATATSAAQEQPAEA
ncbi:Sec-independent protein translocase protein tatA/E-like protein [Thalassoporum mexicanum PCC 7367]|nr:TatA/E family twin arginine-targeting protein translocase [Pseudanabaena sp. PCC 7367]AFY70239.1 Sec-independent protein translocase protein tatA/E-like protein [Pseudanabaena sp. PCC 7367]